MSYKQLTLEDRSQIHAYRQAGFTITETAKRLDRHKSTISRELKRNRGKRGYRPKQADETAAERKRGSSKSIKFTESLKESVSELLKKQWSPEQISNHLNISRKGYISHERIYQFIKEDRKHGGSLYLNLRQGHRKRRKRYGTGMSLRGQIKNRVLIDSRPSEVEKRTTVGHWEGDTVEGKNHKGFIVTLTERKTSYLKMAYVEYKDADSVSKAVVKLLKHIKGKVKTITFDNGKEFSNHEYISQKLDADIYFAHPYHSWERGLNENTNGLIRQYFPKKTDFRKISEKKIAEIERTLNDRPRKKLYYATPFEAFARYT